MNLETDLEGNVTQFSLSQEEINALGAYGLTPDTPIHLGRINDYFYHSYYDVQISTDNLEADTPEDPSYDNNRQDILKRINILRDVRDRLEPHVSRDYSARINASYLGENS
jgi:hypothetical protein